MNGHRKQRQAGRHPASEPDKAETRAGLKLHRILLAQAATFDNRERLPLNRKKAFGPLKG